MLVISETLNVVPILQVTAHYLFYFSIYQISGQQFSRVLIGSRNSEYPWIFTVSRTDRKMARRFAKVSEEEIKTAFFYHLIW